ncbi:MAG TPA: hypothetical protein VE684_06795, partial [Crenalkalicoccus sp.]|nr:hypothetical protein [Crenalkalicoccus sp.]
MLRDCRLQDADGPVQLDIVLLHARRGIAVLQRPHHVRPDVPERVRRRLAAARFPAIFPGTLPIVRCELDRAGLAELPQRLAEGFAREPPLSLPAGDAWMDAVRRILLEPGAPRAERPQVEDALPRWRSAWGAAAMTGLAAAALVAAALIVPSGKGARQGEGRVRSDLAAAPLALP